MATPRRNARFAIERDETHLHGLLVWVNMVAQTACKSLEELRDGAALAAALHNLGGPGPLESLEAVARAAEGALGLKRQAVLLDDQPVPPERIADLIQLLLAFAVQCENKEASVAQIMSLEPGVQHLLMVEVDMALKKCAHINAEPPSPSPFSPDMVERARRRSSMGLGNDVAMSTGGRKRMLRENKAAKEENAELRSDNAALQKQVETLQDELTRLRQDAKEKALRRELELSSANETKEAALLARLESRDQKIALLEASLETAQHEVKQAQALRDQVEVLSAQAQDASKKDAALQRLRAKVEQAGDVTKHLEELERKNDALLQRCLEAEDLASQIPRLRVDLDAAKSAYTDLKLQLSETQATLEEKRKQVERLRADNEELSAAESVVMQENLALQLNLAEPGHEDEGQAGQSLGMSELNPQVREDLQRLRKENERLHASVREHSPENLARLQLENESLTNLRDKAIADLSEAVARGDALEADLAAARAAHAALEASSTQELAALQAALEDARSTAANEKARLVAEQEAQQQEHAEALRALERSAADQLDELQKSASEERRDAEAAHVARSVVEALIADTAHGLEQAQLQEAVEAVRAEARAAQQEAEAHGSAAAALREELEQALADKAAAEAEVRKTTEEAETYRANHASSNEQLDQMQEALATTQRERDEARAQHHDLREQFEAARAEALGRLRDAEAALAREAASLLDAEKSAESERTRADELQFQVGQLRRQLKALQMQRSQAAQRHGGGDDGGGEELRAELGRLAEQVQQLQERNAELQANGGGPGPSAGGKGVSQMVRGYESRIAELEKEAHVLSMSKTRELMSRKDAETKYAQLAKENEELAAENTSFRLRLERLRKASERPKENRTPQHNVASCFTPRKVGSKATTPHLASPKAAAADTENCNQQ